MIEAVVVFAVLSALFEAIVISAMPIRARLWALGHAGVMHSAVIMFNLFIHFGTVTGTMTAIVAGLASFAVMPMLSRYFGTIRGNCYFPGYVRYNYEQIRTRFIEE